MKLIVVLALVAVAAAQEYQQGSDKDAQIIKQEFKEALDQSYSVDVETDNGIASSELGEPLPGPEPETGTLRRSGQYSYTAPNGENIVVSWTADENGYRVNSASVPVGADGQAADGQAAVASAEQ